MQSLGYLWENVMNVKITPSFTVDTCTFAYIMKTSICVKLFLEKDFCHFQPLYCYLSVLKMTEMISRAFGFN